jgi:outer membrane protein TolC
VATTGTLTLAAAIETAVLNNPGLRADFAALEAAALEVPQASSLMDPQFSHMVDGFFEGDDGRRFETELSQSIPWFGKLRLRGDVARSEALQVLQDYRAKVLDVRLQVQQAWYRLAYEQAALALAEEDKQTIEQSLDSAAALYGAGQRGRGALLQSQTELARIENDLAGYPARIAALRQELALLLFVDRLGAVPALDDPAAQQTTLPDAEALIAEAIVVRPEIERFRLGESQAELRHELARRDYYPDFMVGVRYMGEGTAPSSSSAFGGSGGGMEEWGVAVGFNIPIPNARRRAAKEQALRQREEAEWRRIAAESLAEQEVRGLLPRLTSLQRQLDILRGSLMPLAEEAYVTNQTCYTSGQTTFLELLESQRTLIAVRRDLLQARRDYLLAITELERVVGGSLTSEDLP